MLSQRTSTIKPKTSASKRISNIATGRSRLSSTTNNSNSTSNSKTATMEKINNTNSLAAATASQDRESFKVIPECGQDIIMAVDCNVSELSILKMLEGDMKKDGDEDFERKKLREELDTVKKDLAMKNVLVERLMKENSDVRREMNDLLGTLDSAKEQITLKLQVYTARIQELEGEVKTLKYENKLYQEQLQKVVNEKNSRVMEDIDGCVGKYYQESKQKLELFYKSLNYQVAQFLEMSRDQYESLGGALLNCVEGPNRIASVRNMNRAQTPDKTRSPLRSSISKSNLTLSPQPKGRGLATPAASGRDSVPRSLSNYDTDRRRRLATLHNLNDLAAVNIRVESSFGSASSKNEWSRKSPKDLFSPKMKNEPFRINTQPLDEKRE